MNSKLIASIEILRPLNVVIMMLVVAAAVILAGGDAGDWDVIVIASLVAGLIGGAANVINDYFDMDIDRINKPERPLPRGALNPEFALKLWMILTLAGISLNVFLHSHAFAIAVAAALILFLYSARWKRRLFIGNLAVALMTAMAFVYGAAVIGNPERALVPALFAFLINLGREIIKDAEDMEGDTHGRAMTLPLRFGIKKALIAATMVLVVLLALTAVAAMSDVYNRLFLWIILVVDLVIVYVVVSMWISHTPRNLGKLSFILKVNMLIGLLALYVGS